MEKLILRKQRRRPNDNLYRVRISGEAYETVEKLAEVTNMSLNDVVSKMLMFAAAHIEIQEES